MIVKNEERVLEACLESISPWVDEIIIVDTGSTDKTKQIAEKFTRNVYDFPWIDDFSAARNESLGHATGDWIFWIDADDTVPVETGQRIRALAASAGTGIGAFTMRVVLPSAPGEIGTRTINHTKLFRNIADYRFYGAIHEQISEPILRSGKQILDTDLEIIHSSHDFSEEGRALKQEREIKILRKEIENNPTYAFNWFNLGLVEFRAENYPGSIDALSKFFTLLHGASSSVSHQAYYHLSIGYEFLGNIAISLQVAENGLSEFPDDPALQFQAANLYAKLSKNEKAETLYKSSLAPRDIYPVGFEMNIRNILSPLYLGILLKKQCRYDEAEPYFYSVLGFDPNNSAVLADLSEIHAANNDTQKLSVTYLQLLRSDPDTAKQLRANILDLYRIRL